MDNLRPSVADKRQTFRKLHESGCFVIPNPWNVGSARYLQGLGFKALATTSSGHAHSEGYADGAQAVDDVLAHYRELAAATDVPVNADFENGFADDPERRRRERHALHRDRRRRAVDRGFAARCATPLYDFDLAVARVKAARAAIDKAGGDVVFTARTEGFIRGRARSRRDHPPAQGLRRRRRRLPLRAGHQDARADRGGGEGGRRRSRSISSTAARSASR